ncbi:MAG: hypothetical protein ACRD3W_27755 [Terriglobales bacterium]
MSGQEINSRAFDLSRALYRNEFEKDGLEKVRDNVLRHPYEDLEQQEQAKEWIEEKEGAYKRAYEHRLEIAAWLAAFFAFIAAVFSVAIYLSLVAGG